MVLFANSAKFSSSKYSARLMSTSSSSTKSNLMLLYAGVDSTSFVGPGFSADSSYMSAGAPEIYDLLALKAISLLDLGI